MIIIWLKCPADEVILCRVRRVQESLRWNDSVTESVTTQPCQAVCCCVSVVCLFVCLFVCLLSGSLTAALRREVFGPEQNSAVLLGGRVCCQSAAGSPGESAAQVGVCACVSGCVCVCVCVCVVWTLLLVWLSLSNNRLRLPADVSAHVQAFSSLRVLALNSCDITWSQVRRSRVHRQDPSRKSLTVV